MELREFEDDEGRSPFKVWFRALDVIAAARIQRVLTRLELGNTSNVKGVGGGVFELKSILVQAIACTSGRMEVKSSSCSVVERRSDKIATSIPRWRIG